MAAEKILSRYPDYGKTSREYIGSLAELLATYPDDTLRTVVDQRIGVSARCKFLPTHADIIEYVERLEDRRYATRDLRQGRVPEPIGNGQKPDAFPKLTSAFKAEPTLLQRNFDCLYDASRALAIDGPESAREILRKGKTI